MKNAMHIGFAASLLLLLSQFACGGDDGGGGPFCGDNMLDMGEECDDGNADNGDGCSDQCLVELPTAFRLNQLELRDPNLFAGGFLNVTNTVNTSIADAIAMDEDNPPDDILDLSILINFLPYNSRAATNSIETGTGLCTAPESSTSCMNDPDAPPTATSATNMDSTCLEPLAGTTSDYLPPIISPGPRCFVSDAETISIPLGDIVIVLEDARIAATYGPNGDTLTDGMIRGFMSETDAMNTIIPDSVALVGGDPLSSLLKEEDKDMSPTGVSGWYFYTNFTAVAVPFQ